MSVVQNINLHRNTEDPRPPGVFLGLQTPTLSDTDPTPIRYRPYTDPIQTLHRYDTDPTPIRYRPYTDQIQTLHRYDTDHTPIQYRPYTDPIQTIHPSDTDPTPIRYRPYTHPIQTIHRSDTDHTPIRYRPYTHPIQTIHPSDTDQIPILTLSSQLSSRSQPHAGAGPRSARPGRAVLHGSPAPQSGRRPRRRCSLHSESSRAGGR
jgi:hypothetical protein